MNQHSELVTPVEAARMKGVTRTAIYNAVAEGRLPHSRILGRIALTKADVLKWKPMRYAGRPKGIPASEETKARMSAAHKRRWAQRKQDQNKEQQATGRKKPKLP